MNLVTNIEENAMQLSNRKLKFYVKNSYLEKLKEIRDKYPEIFSNEVFCSSLYMWYLIESNEFMWSGIASKVLKILFYPKEVKYKDILYILEQEKVLNRPKSYNVTLGICKSIKFDEKYSKSNDLYDDEILNGNEEFTIVEFDYDISSKQVDDRINEFKRVCYTYNYILSSRFYRKEKAKIKVHHDIFETDAFKNTTEERRKKIKDVCEKSSNNVVFIFSQKSKIGRVYGITNQVPKEFRPYIQKEHYNFTPRHKQYSIWNTQDETGKSYYNEIDKSNCALTIASVLFLNYIRNNFGNSRGNDIARNLLSLEHEFSVKSLAEFVSLDGYNLVLKMMNSVKQLPDYSKYKFIEVTREEVKQIVVRYFLFGKIYFKNSKDSLGNKYELFEIAMKHFCPEFFKFVVITMRGKNKRKKEFARLIFRTEAKWMKLVTEELLHRGIRHTLIHDAIGVENRYNEEVINIMNNKFFEVFDEDIKIIEKFNLKYMELGSNKKSNFVRKIRLHIDNLVNDFDQEKVKNKEKRKYERKQKKIEKIEESRNQERLRKQSWENHINSVIMQN